ncbi:hypothetical protein ACLB2K_053338 [Fragaria x ananassa]
MKEIVTLQAGGFANFVGSHFWNFQGVPTYTPQLLSVDLQGSLGSMSSSGTVYNGGSSVPSSVMTWDIVEQLENDVQYWTDYSKAHYHPQSLYELSGPWIDAHKFDNYGIGRDSFSGGLHGEEMSDRLRFFIEESDHIQGFQFIVDDSGGKASRLLCIKDEKPYHCSAVYAATLDSVSMPFRMEPLGPSADSTYASGALTVNEVVQILSGQARQNMVAILDAAMPAPSLTGNQVEQTFLRNLQPLTPEVLEHVEDLQSVESMIVLGALGTGGQQASINEVKSMVHAAYEHAITRPIFSHLSVAQCPLPMPLPFPSIFRNRVGQHGELLGTPVIDSSSRGSFDVHSIPIAARLRSSSAVLPFLENRWGDLRKFGIARGGPGAELLRSWGFAKDESEDMGETLSKMIMELNPRTQTSSDSDLLLVSVTQTKKMDVSQHSKYSCEFCAKFAVKRKAVGIWGCKDCDKVKAGGAYTLNTAAAVTVRSTIRRLREQTEYTHTSHPLQLYIPVSKNRVLVLVLNSHVCCIDTV